LALPARCAAGTAFSRAGSRGVFVYGVAVLPVKRFSALALGVMMLPISTRSTEELLTLMPVSLCEAALALGATRGRAMFSVILPAAAPGMVTGSRSRARAYCW
jgi:phosphate transport system permease protein